MFCQRTKQFWGTILGIVVTLLLIVARPGRAVGYQDQFNENFDSPLLDLPAQWELLQGNWQDWILTGGRLQAQLQAPSSVISMISPKDHIWPNFKNYKVSFTFTSHDNIDKNFAIFFRSQLGFNDRPILDMIDFHFFNNQLHIDDIEVGCLVHSRTLNFPLEIDKEYQIVITHLNGQFTLYVDDQLIYATDDNWPEFKLGAGKIAFRASRGNYPSSISSFDNLLVEPYFDLSLPLLMQSNIEWSNELYDSANLWAGDENSIADWGCALTSAVMLLHYYGYDSLGEKALNPKTLNQWLIEQPDGYVGDGLVNWLAICRLVVELTKDCEDCPKLEYQYFAGNEEDLNKKIKSQLELKQPVIGHIEKHFLVIDGLGEGGDFTIKDPYFPIEYLSEEERSLLSLRLFTPSFTDLSYWFFELPKTAKIDIEGIELLAANVNWPGDRQFYYLAKPATGNYQLDFKFFNQEDLAKANVYLYSEEGLVQFFNLEELLANEIFFNPQDFSLELNYSKDGVSQLFLIAEKPVMTFYLEYQLQELLNWQSEERLKENRFGVERYQNLINQFLSFYDLSTLQL